MRDDVFVEGEIRPAHFVATLWPRIVGDESHLDSVLGQIAGAEARAGSFGSALELCRNGPGGAMSSAMRDIVENCATTAGVLDDVARHIRGCLVGVRSVDDCWALFETCMAAGLFEEGVLVSRSFCDATLQVQAIADLVRRIGTTVHREESLPLLLDAVERVSAIDAEDPEDRDSALSVIATAYAALDEETLWRQVLLKINAEDYRLPPLAAMHLSDWPRTEPPQPRHSFRRCSQVWRRS
jgi:hypothetical protein